MEAVAAITTVNPHAGTTDPVDIARRKVTVLGAERHVVLATLVKITIVTQAAQVTRTRTDVMNHPSKDTIAKKRVVTVHRK